MILQDKYSIVIISGWQHSSTRSRLQQASKGWSHSEPVAERGSLRSGQQ